MGGKKRYKRANQRNKYKKKKRITNALSQLWKSIYLLLPFLPFATFLLEGGGILCAAPRFVFYCPWVVSCCLGRKEKTVFVAELFCFTSELVLDRGRDTGTPQK